MASLKLNRKCLTLFHCYLLYSHEENAAVNESNRFTERFNFQLAFNLSLSKLFKAYLS